MWQLFASVQCTNGVKICIILTMILIPHGFAALCNSNTVVRRILPWIVEIKIMDRIIGREETTLVKNSDISLVLYCHTWRCIKTM